MVGENRRKRIYKARTSTLADEGTGAANTGVVRVSAVTASACLELPKGVEPFESQRRDRLGHTWRGLH